MAKQDSQLRRKQMLKQRRAEEQREWNREDAGLLFRDAFRAHRDGDLPAAARLLKKALVLDPDHKASLSLLADIHQGAGHHAEALAYLRRLQKIDGGPNVLYNIGFLYNEMEQLENAAGFMREFLAAATGLREPKWRRMRESAEAICEKFRRAPRMEKPAPSPPKPATPSPPPEAPTKAEKPPELPPVGVQFFPAAAPGFANPGTVADYFLRRQWIELRLAQNFEDLLCLPSLHGVDAYVYQQETVRRVLRHFKGRALLADEVGLGKTIEACLVLKEYWMRGLVRKALVLTPPSLVSQWKSELTEKFGLVPVSPDTAQFRGDPARFWKEEPLVVASIAQARLDANAAAIGAVAWDMVIVDEAHCLKNRASANWQLVDSLQKKFILMLTATPVENNLIELYNLITLLKPGLLATEAEFRKTYVTSGKPKSPKNPEHLRSMLGDVMIRNTRAAADVQLPHRVAATVLVAPSEAEARMYEMVSRFIAGRYRTASGKKAPPLALDLMQRQAGSSPQALSRSVARALREETWVRPEDRRELETILDLAAGVEESAKGARLGDMLSAHAWSMPGAQALSAPEPQAPPGQSAQALLAPGPQALLAPGPQAPREQSAQTPGKAVVFTEFIPTLDHLKHICEARGIKYSLFSGDLSRAEKDAAIARFRDEARVLLSTGAGGEGRNLQFADTIVNFDLPWNPMRIEQRVGRVHRIGQTRDVFVFNFCQAGTVEEQLLRVLHDKINMFELVVGEMDAILGTLDDSRDFAEIVMDLWISGRESGQVEREFEELARRLLEAKEQQTKAQELDEALFAHDFEV
jgi:SNF2 family DNA or RNA helicase